MIDVNDFMIFWCSRLFACHMLKSTEIVRDSSSEKMNYAIPAEFFENSQKFALVNTISYSFVQCIEQVHQCLVLAVNNFMPRYK